MKYLRENFDSHENVSITGSQIKFGDQDIASKLISKNEFTVEQLVPEDYKSLTPSGLERKEKLKYPVRLAHSLLKTFSKIYYEVSSLREKLEYKIYIRTPTCQVENVVKWIKEYYTRELEIFIGATII